MANGQDQKLTNSIQILNELRTGPKSRKYLCDELDLQPSTVTYSIKRLMELNYVNSSNDVSKENRARGRKSTQLVLNKKSGVVFGVDLLVDRFKVSICYIDKSEFLKISEPFDDLIINAKKGSSERFFQCVNYILSLIETKCANTTLYGGCIGIAGIVANDERTILKSFTHGAKNLSLEECFSKRNYNIFLENDANCAAYKYLSYYNDTFLYSLARIYDWHDILDDVPQIGLGIGIISQGKINKGWESKAGEFSNFVYQDGKQNRQLDCPNEVLADINSSPNRLNEFLDNYVNKLLFSNALLNPRTIYLGGDNKVWKEQIINSFMKYYDIKDRKSALNTMCFTFLENTEDDISVGASYFMLDFLFDLSPKSIYYESPLFKEILKK